MVGGDSPAGDWASQVKQVSQDRNASGITVGTGKIYTRAIGDVSAPRL
jgi:hypothetical protein